MGKILPKRKYFKSSIYRPNLNVGSHIDNVRYSLEHLIFLNTKETEDAILKKRIKIVIIVTLISMIVGSFFSPKGKAEVATFYPSSCLGGWNNPHNAEGMPETLDNVPNFTLTNSASLAKDVLADLYCGTFKGTIPTATIPKKIILTLAWKGMTEEELKPISGEAFASSTLNVLDATSSVGFTSTSTNEVGATTTSSQATSTSSTTDPVIDQSANKAETVTPTVPVVPDVAPVSEPLPASNPAPSSTPSADVSPAPSIDTSAPQSFLIKMGTTFARMIAEQVYAESTTTVISSSDTLVVSGSSTDQPSSGTSTASTTLNASSTDPSTATSTTQISTTTDPIFEVLYTLDGDTWLSLGKVNAKDMSYNTFEIPVTSSSTWNDISNIQIKIKSLSTTDAKPTVLIDGMALNVEYENETPVDTATSTEIVGDPKRYDMKITSSTGNIVAAITNDADQGNILNVSSPKGGSLVVYKNASGDIVYSSGLGADTLPISSYIFDPGTFTLVITSREDGCSNATSTECVADLRTIGSLNFTITPTVNTPTKYVHTE